MIHRPQNEDFDQSLTLEEAYLVFDRLNPFHPSGPPSADMIRRLEGQAAARKMFYGRQTLLHKCCCDGYGGRLDLVEALVAVHHEAVGRFDDEGFWPLHYVVASIRGRHNGRLVNEEVLKLLIRQNPLALLQATRNDRRAIPLHLACENPALTVEVLDILLQVFPETLYYRDGNGLLPIECALRTSELPAAVVQRLTDGASVLLSFVRDGMLPLHHFIDSLESESDHVGRSSSSAMKSATVLDRIIEACPGTLGVQTPDHKSPLLMACEKDVGIPSVYAILRAWPEQVITQTHLILGRDDEWNGVWLPTHLLQSNLRLTYVSRWLREDPRATSTVDAAGRLALHYAVATGAPCAIALVRTILDTNPTALQHKDNNGRLPIHYLSLSAHKDRDELLSMFLARDASALAEPDNERCLPWMYAELVQFFAITEASMAQGIAVDSSQEDLPTEVRWDIVQVVPNEDSSDTFYD